MAKRIKLEIIKDILNIIKENHNLIKPTPLLRKSNISSLRFKKYIQELFDKNFVKTIHNKKGKFFSITDKGNRFLEKYKTIINFINEFDL